MSIRIMLENHGSLPREFEMGRVLNRPSSCDGSNQVFGAFDFESVFAADARDALFQLLLPLRYEYRTRSRDLADAQYLIQPRVKLRFFPVRYPPDYPYSLVGSAYHEIERRPL